MSEEPSHNLPISNINILEVKLKSDVKFEHCICTFLNGYIVVLSFLAENLICPIYNWNIWKLWNLKIKTLFKPVRGFSILDNYFEQLFLRLCLIILSKMLWIFQVDARLVSCNLVEIKKKKRNKGKEKCLKTKFYFGFKLEN